MNRMGRYRPAFLTGLAACVLGLGGCVEYRIETTVNADGSGSRQERMIVAESKDDADNSVSPADFGYLMFVTEDFRWTHRREVDEGDTVDVFLRETQVRGRDAWSDLSGTVHIAGTTGSAAETRVGNVRLGDVHFRNKVRVETGRVTEGASFTYRETFYWDNLAEALVEYVVQRYTNAVMARYGDLNAAQRGEMVAAVSGAIWYGVGQGLFDASGDREAELVSAIANRMANRAVEIVRRRYPDAREEFFAALLKEIYDDDEKFESFIRERLPGVNLAINSEITFRLTMPGRVTTSNAHDRDGNTLVWEFAPGDALTAPLEIVAESVVER